MHKRRRCERGRAREGVFPSRKWGSGDFPRENFANYALVICNHAFPPGQGNSGDFDFSEIKTTAMPLRIGDKNMVKPGFFPLSGSFPLQFMFSFQFPLYLYYKANPLYRRPTAGGTLLVKTRVIFPAPLPG